MNRDAILSTWNLVAEALPTASSRVTKLQTPSGCFYLKASASAESAERDLDLLEYLASARLPVPRYIATAAGRRYAMNEGRAFWLLRDGSRTIEAKSNWPSRVDDEYVDPGGLLPVNAQTFEQIETKIAFLERANSELSDVVFRQHRDIEALRAQIAGLAARIDAVQSDTAVRTPEDERPPHY